MKVLSLWLIKKLRAKEGKWLRRKWPSIEPNTLMSHCNCGKRACKGRFIFNLDRWIDGASRYSGNNEGESDFKVDMLRLRACEIVYWRCPLRRKEIWAWNPEQRWLLKASACVKSPTQECNVSRRHRTKPWENEIFQFSCYLTKSSFAKLLTTASSYGTLFQCFIDTTVFCFPFLAVKESIKERKTKKVWECQRG